MNVNYDATVAGVDGRIVRRDPGWLTELLACPRCHGSLTSSDEAWHCADCGVVGRRTVGFPDFLVGVETLPMAGGDAMDLARDADDATELADGPSRFTELVARAAALQGEALGRREWSEGRQRACDRALDRIRRLNVDSSKLGGEALLSKVDSRIEDCGWAPLGGGTAVEAAGGPGFFLPAFSRRFARVVFLDASVLNLVLAERLCSEQGIDNVSFVRADVAAPPLATGRFDMIHENGVIEHVHTPRRMLAEAVRLRSEQGYLVCVSPNRYSLAPEPHFGIPLYGLVPPLVRRALVPRFRGFEDGVGTDLLSLRRLRAEMSAVVDPDDMTVFFLPRRLAFTARATPVRRLIKQSLDLPLLGSMVDKVLNDWLLGLAPQHIVIARTPPRSSEQMR